MIKSQQNVFYIRFTVLDDLPNILPLLTQLEYPTTNEDLFSRFKNFLKNPGYGVAVAELNHKISGMIAWSKSYFFVSSKARFHLEAIIVDKNYRNMKIGEKLIGFLEEIAYKERSCVIDLTLGVRHEESGTHAFYKKLGYDNSGRMAKLYFRKELV
jgi:ribosomal protein S18 acetylase RimI-like enzyme